MPIKVCWVKIMVFPVVMYRCERVPKNWCFWTVVLEKTLECPLDCKEIQLVHPKGDRSWVFIGRTDAEAETSILWPPDGKSRLIGKDPDAGKDRRQEEKRVTEDEVVGWHHWFNGHEFEQALGDGEGQESLEFMGWKSQTQVSDWKTNFSWNFHGVTLRNQLHWSVFMCNVCTFLEGTVQ